VRDLRRLKRLTQLNTRLRDAVRANFADADEQLRQSEAAQDTAVSVYEAAIAETTHAGEIAAYQLLGNAERATRGQLDVRDAAQVVAERAETREVVQGELREAHREMKAMELLTQRERNARQNKRDQAEQAVTEEVVASKRARST
jgi:hypothetical protein